MTLNTSLNSSAAHEIGELFLDKLASGEAIPPAFEFCSLATMLPGQKGWIEHVEEGDSSVMDRLLEMGLIEGSSIEVMHQAPFGGDPIAVKVRGGLIALRRHEAASVQVRKVPL